MVWTIPNTFVAGTRAVAQEVNENFTSAKQFMDQLETQVASNEIDISTLQTNKANINGDSTETFAVANPNSDYEAVNLQTLEDRTLNSRGVINGFTLSKVGNKQINAAPGYCYNNTFEYMIKSTLTLTKTETLSANTTYYVYAVADAQTDEVQLEIDTSATTPSLPTGFDYYRRIGRFTTNSSGNIDKVFSEGAVDLSNTVGFINPSRLLKSYSNRGTYSYTPTEDCWLFVHSHGRSCNCTVSINGTQILPGIGYWEGDDAIACSSSMPIKAGQAVTVTINNAQASGDCYARFHGMLR